MGPEPSATTTAARDAQVMSDLSTNAKGLPSLRGWSLAGPNIDYQRFLFRSAHCGEPDGQHKHPKDRLSSHMPYLLNHRAGLGSSYPEGPEGV
jgi:hypothetical protein